MTSTKSRLTAKPPKYDIYGNDGMEDDGACNDDCELGMAVEGFSEEPPTASLGFRPCGGGAPLHSTPVSAGAPPVTARLTSTDSTSTSIKALIGSLDGNRSNTPSNETSPNTVETGLQEKSSVGSRYAKSGSFNNLLEKSKLSSCPPAHSRNTVPLLQSSSSFRTPECKSIVSCRASSSKTSSDRTPGSKGSCTRTSSSRHSRTPGSGLSRTPGSGHSRTPGSARSRTPRSAQGLPPSTVVALVEGRGQARGEVGVAAIDLNCPQLSLAQFSDTHTYTRTLTKLTILNPIEVVVASTAVEGCDPVGGNSSSGLMRVVQECVAEASVTAVHRRYFNDTRGLAMVKHLAAPNCAYVERLLATKYYCLAAVAALMKYVEHIQHVTYAPNSLHIVLTTSENTMNIEYSSCRKLELVRSLRGGWQESLFGAMRHTRTPSGTRLLRASLLQPYADLATIRSRLDTLQYLVENPDLFYTLQSIIGRFPDIDWLLSMCVQLPKEETEKRCELRLNYVISLKNTLELLEPLATVLSDVTDPFLITVKEAVSVEELQELLTLLREVLHEDARLVKGGAAMRTQRCFAIKSNINSLLDVARKIYSEIIDDIVSHVEELANEHSLPLKVGHNAARGFHITIPIVKKAPPPRLPRTLIQVQRSRGCITCTTEQVYQLDQRSRDTLREILIMSNVIVQEMLVEARGRIVGLHGLGEAVASLDLVVALGHAAAVGCWVRPEFSNTLAIQNGRHPILDVLAPTQPIPNNTFLSDGSRVMVVTGPNMSGKSTYLRQIALIQILAQVGSFVPAEFASLRLVSHLFTHLGSEDSPENNASTFQVQMSDVAHMLGSAGPNSLVLLDELGSGTSVEEGGALAWAIIETLIHAKATTVLATHILFLTRLADLYPCVTNYHLESMDEGNGLLNLTHVVRQGVTQATNYGLALAKMMPFPSTILQRAEDLAHTMTPSTQVRSRDDGESFRRRAIYHLAHRLIALAEATHPLRAGFNQCSSASSSCSLVGEGSHDEEAREGADEEAQTQEVRAQLQNLLQDFIMDLNRSNEEEHNEVF